MTRKLPSNSGLGFMALFKINLLPKSLWTPINWHLSKQCQVEFFAKGVDYVIFSLAHLLTSVIISFSRESLKTTENVLLLNFC